MKRLAGKFPASFFVLSNVVIDKFFVFLGC